MAGRTTRTRGDNDGETRREDDDRPEDGDRDEAREAERTPADEERFDDPEPVRDEPSDERVEREDLRHGVDTRGIGEEDQNRGLERGGDDEIER